MPTCRSFSVVLVVAALTLFTQVALEVEGSPVSGFADYEKEEDEKQDKRDLDSFAGYSKKENGQQKRNVESGGNVFKEITLEVDTHEATPYFTTKIFVSVGVASTIFYHVHYDDFAVEDNRRFFNLAAALAPAVVRVGGSGANFLVFVPDGNRFPVTEANKKVFYEKFGVPFWEGEIGRQFEHFNVSSTQWKRIHQFFKDVGWLMNFNTNNFMLYYGDTWESSNLQLLFDFLEEEDLPLYGLQMFNEPNSYEVKYGDPGARTPAQLVDDWRRLAAFQNLSENAYFKNTLRIGPDVTSIGRHESSYHYLQEFFQEGGHIYQDVLGLHHYYFGGLDALAEDFLNPDHMDTLTKTLKRARGLVETYKPDMPIHLSEASNAFSGGSDLFSHSFISIFLFMDMLGQAALHGVEVVNRYTYFSGAYGMMGAFSTPRPDYWVALLHKQLIEGPVLLANVSNYGGHLRTYLSCVNEEYRFDGEDVANHGAVLSYVNTNSEDVKLMLPEDWYTRTLHLFILTGQPGVDDMTMFTSENIYLNGEILEMTSDCVPKMVGEEISQVEYVMLPRFSAGFINIVNAHAHDCKYNRNTRR